MTNDNQDVVWKANYSPFGVADITVNTVTNNLRFPGQYFDQETNLHYNYFRYYDPATGRYIASDPIGIVGGLNTYGYVGGNPVRYTDPNGLETYRCTKPLDAVTEKFGEGVSKWAHDNLPWTYHQYSCIVEKDGTVTCGGQDRGAKNKEWSEYGGYEGKPSNDSKKKARQCEKTQDDNKCFEDCLKDEWKKPRPKYGIPRGIDCQDYDDDVNETCRKQCGL